MDKKTLTAATKKVKDLSGTGKEISWHVINGSQAYRDLFTALLKLLEEHDLEPFWVYKKELIRRAKIHPSMAGYPLTKMEQADLIQIIKKGSVVSIQKYQLENWGDLCKTVQQS